MSDAGGGSRGNRQVKVVVAAAVAFAALVIAAEFTRPSTNTTGRQPNPQATVTVTAQPGQADGSSTTDQQTQAAPGTPRRDANDVAALGAVDAPVVIIEYADFRCPFCALYARDTMPTLVKEYVEPGLVRYEYRDAPMFGDQSIDAAVAARAAGTQGQYWAYFNTIAANAPTSGHPDLPRDILVAFAQQAGVEDLTAFESALADPAHLQAVLRDQQETQALGINSVPFFVINGKAMSGAQPLEAFRSVIDEQLKAAGVTQS